jgi:hypothetical protein
MIAQDLVRPGAAFVGADGEVRHVIIVHKPGSGYSVSWDSVPLDGEYWAGCVAGLHKTRPHGYMPMRKFQKWAIEQVEAKAASHNTKGERN